MKLPSLSKPKTLAEARTHILSLGRSMHEHAYLLGKCLMWVKDEVGHGNFLPWVEKNLWFGERTARRMIEFAERCDKSRFLLEYHQAKSDLKTDLNSQPLPPGKYRILYADPPWKYNDELNGLGAARYYACMSITELCALDVPDLAADNAVLFLWVTCPLALESSKVIEAWDFK